MQHAGKLLQHADKIMQYAGKLLQHADKILQHADLIDFWCFNSTFCNISALSWRPVLVVEETGVPGENHRTWASNW
jgi:hypothetical protein